MKGMAMMMLALALAGAAQAAEGPATVKLKAGEMRLMDFLEMVSEKLDVSIDASETDGDPSIQVPDLGAITPERATELVLTTLYLQGFTWIHDRAASLYRVLRLRDARDQEIPMIEDPTRLPDSDLLVTAVIQIRHLPPEDVARVMRSFMPANSRIVPDEATGAVLITDSARNIGKLKKIIENLDTPAVAKRTREGLSRRVKGVEADCGTLEGHAQGPRPAILIALFSLIALVIGFLARGYVIRRIEGGL